MTNQSEETNKMLQSMIEAFNNGVASMDSQTSDVLDALTDIYMKNQTIHEDLSFIAEKLDKICKAIDSLKP